jgi:hypothetical protein
MKDLIDKKDARYYPYGDLEAFSCLIYWVHAILPLVLSVFSNGSQESKNFVPLSGLSGMSDDSIYIPKRSSDLALGLLFLKNVWENYGPIQAVATVSQSRSRAAY